MQSRYFKRLLPLTAVALLILAFLAIEIEQDTPCEALQPQTEEGRRILAAPNPEHLKEYQEIGERAEEILPKYEDLFWRQPNVWSTRIGLFNDKNRNYMRIPDGKGGCKMVVGFIISVTEKVDQNTLPPEDRIPDVLEGISVQIIEESLPSGSQLPAIKTALEKGGFCLGRIT